MKLKKMLKKKKFFIVPHKIVGSKYDFNCLGTP